MGSSLSSCCLGRDKAPEIAEVAASTNPASPSPESVVLLRRPAPQLTQTKGSPVEPPAQAPLYKQPTSTEAITQELLDDAFENQVAFFCRGRMAKNQNPGDERPWASFGDAGNLTPEMIACQKGKKASVKDTPNQDNFSVTRFPSGHTLALVCDGHGKKGHQAATRAVQTIPFLLLQLGLSEEAMEAAVEKALIEAFEKAGLDLGMNQESGCTAVAALWKGTALWTANAGDSRCVLLEDDVVVFATSDHKPSCPQERARVERAGGEVRNAVNDVARVFERDQSGPGLAMTRALGDAAAKRCGVIATPEVRQLSVAQPEKAKVVLASDGIWEVIGLDQLPRLVVDADTGKLQSAAFDGWAELTSGGYRDDVTSLIIPIK